MITRQVRTLTALSIAATGLLLAACTSSGAPTHANTAGTHPSGGSAVASSTLVAGAADTPNGTASQAATAGASACALVTEQDLTPLLGADPGPGNASSDATTTSCAYTQGVAVTIGVDHGGGRSQFDLFCPTNQAQHTNQARSGPLTVSGVGEGACLTIVGGTGPVAAMYILEGSDLMSINIQAGLDTKVTPAALTALGRTAAGRL